jgi:hypothetical protein
MFRPIRPSTFIAGILFVVISLRPALGFSPHPTLTPGAGEVTLSPGILEGSFLLSASVRRAISPCLDLGGSFGVIPDRDPKSELYLTTEVRYGLWFCCIPDRYINYLYLSAGAGSFSRMGGGTRENDFTLTYGPGLRVDLFGKVILGGELKAFTVFREGGRVNRLAFLLTGGLPL